MKNKTIIQSVFFTFLLFAATFNTYSYLVTLNSIEFDATGTATYIVDGDTFDISTGDRVRFADINCPEIGEPGSYEATEFLSRLIYNKRVYLDIDDYYTTGPYGRLICLVYVDYNSTHYLNVNEALLETNMAYISNYDNEFEPYQWTLFVEKTTSGSRLRTLGLSLGIAFTFTLIAYGALKLGWKIIRGQITSITDR